MSSRVHLPTRPLSHSPVQLFILAFWGSPIQIILCVHISLKYPATFLRPQVFAPNFLQMYNNTRITIYLKACLPHPRYVLIYPSTPITLLCVFHIAPNDTACPHRYRVPSIPKVLPCTTYYITYRRNLFFLNVTDNLAIRLSSHLEDINFRSRLETQNETWGLVSDRSYIFTDSYVLPPYSFLCNDAHRSLDIANAGGKSEISEMYSIDYFAQMYGATNTILETEVDYYYQHKMIDFICTINGRRVGISVTRGMGYPSPDNFTADTASCLIYKKLHGLVVARDIVVEEQSFSMSILHIWCQNYRIAHLLHNAFFDIDLSGYVKGTVLLQLTVCDDSQLYKNFIR